jgi:cystathionine beta-lyase
MSDTIKESTKLIHGGISRDRLTDAVNIPIYQTSTFAQEIPGVHKGYEYSRTGNPTREALESLIADLEHGTSGYAFASGMAAITAVLTLFKSGDRLILSDNVYGGTFRVLDKVFKQFGLKYTMVDTSDISDIEREIAPDVRAVYIETPTNPLLKITDINAVSELAKKNGLLTIVDNTFFTPYLQKPIDHGADIVIHSATKYLGGHSDLVAGLVVVNDEKLAEKIAFIQNSTGGILGPFDSFLLIRGIRTLGVRLDRHVENAEYLADFLENSPDVNKVYYPGLKGAQGYEVNRSQARNGGAMISFELTKGHDMDRFFRALKTITLAESLGGVESLVCHPATMTHASIPADIRHKAGISDELIRLSVGIEDKEDLKLDLENAFAEAGYEVF